MKFSIWIIPSEPVFSETKKIIDQLASENNSISFEPHITIVGRIEKDLDEIEEIINKVSKRHKPLTLHLGVVSFSTTYFQSVLVRINSAAELLNLNLDLKKELNLNNDVFMPHMSLLYGNHDMETRERIASKIVIPSQSFDAFELIVTPSTENPSDWKHLLSFPLNKN